MGLRYAGEDGGVIQEGLGAEAALFDDFPGFVVGCRVVVLALKVTLHQHRGAAVTTFAMR